MRYMLALLLTLSAPASTLYVVGDSLSIGYTPHLAAILGPDWEVAHNPGNAQDTNWTLAHLDEWLPPSADYDVIVCNWGMWDLTRTTPNGPPRSTLPQYEANVRQLLTRMLARADRVIVPNVTRIGPEYPAWARVDADAVAYGAVLHRVAGELGCELVNVYGPTSTHPEWYSADGVHMAIAGNRALGGIVANAVLVPEVPAVGACGFVALCVAMGFGACKRVAPPRCVTGRAWGRHIGAI